MTLTEVHRPSTIRILVVENKGVKNKGVGSLSL